VYIASSFDATSRNAWVMYHHGCGGPIFTTGFGAISPEGLDLHFRCIDSKLSVYAELKDAPALLELAIWKSKINEQTDGIIDMKVECRIDSLSMVVFIIPYVLSFVTDDSKADNVVDGDNDDDSDGSDWDNDDDNSNGSDLDDDDDGG
jgi:hypothetical protein